MKKSIRTIAFLFTFLVTCIQVTAQQAADKSWSKHKTMAWYKKQEWLKGVPLKPHKSIDQEQFARQYHSNQAYWDKAFAFLKEHNLQSLAKGKYPIDGDNVFATVTEDPTKEFDKTNWESHRKYIDLQCVITGTEKMGKHPVATATVTKPYDETKDLANYSAEGMILTVPAGTYIIFFPTDAHRPNITPGGNQVVKKIVIKVRVAE